MNFCRGKRSVAFVTGHLVPFLVVLSLICLVTTQILMCENQTVCHRKEHTFQKKPQYCRKTEKKKLIYLDSHGYYVI